jgi:AAA+ superfamily predicted ATPase
MRSRFTDTFFFDLPTQEERDVIWDVICKKNGMADDTTRPASDEGWVARDIVHCVEKAWTLCETIEEAATRINCEGIKTREDIKRLRAGADQRYSSTTYRGLYRMPARSVPLVEEQRAMAE